MSNSLVRVSRRDDRHLAGRYPPCLGLRAGGLCPNPRWVEDGMRFPAVLPAGSNTPSVLPAQARAEPPARSPYARNPGEGIPDGEKTHRITSVKGTAEPDTTRLLTILCRPVARASAAAGRVGGVAPSLTDTG